MSSRSDKTSSKPGKVPAKVPKVPSSTPIASTSKTGTSSPSSRGIHLGVLVVVCVVLCIVVVYILMRMNDMSGRIYDFPVINEVKLVKEMEVVKREVSKSVLDIGNAQVTLDQKLKTIASSLASLENKLSHMEELKAMEHEEVERIHDRDNDVEDNGKDDETEENGKINEINTVQTDNCI